MFHLYDAIAVEGDEHGLGGRSAVNPVLGLLAARSGLPHFVIRASQRRENHFVIVNYYRKALGQEWGGHISPLAAYDEKQDKFLILDVARYKYPPVWVSSADLYAAMNTPDIVNSGKTRGYVLVSKKAP